MLSREAYEALDGVNFSTLKEMARSPAHYQAALKAPKKATDAMELGVVFHLATLEPQALGERVAVWDEGVRRGKAWDAFREKHAGKTLVTRDDYEQALAMAERVRSSPQAAPYINGGKAEVTLQWESLGVKCKGRVDYLTPLNVVDLKSTRDASLEAFGRQMFNARVHAQLAFYRQGAGEPRGCVLVACENSCPFEVQVYRLTEAQLEQGAAEFEAWLLTLKQCRETGRWGGYWPTETDLQFPRWSNPQEEFYE